MDEHTIRAAQRALDEEKLDLARRRKAERDVFMMQQAQKLLDRMKEEFDTNGRLTVLMRIDLEKFIT